MGNKRSGRRRLPTETKRVRGSRIRHDTEREPTWGGHGRPPLPPQLAADDYAVPIWHALSATLEQSKVLSPAHGDMLVVLAEALADYRRKREEWAMMGRKSVIVQSWDDIQGKHRTRIVDNPIVKQLRGQADLVMRLLGEFGLSPATSSKVVTQDAGGEDPFDTFLAGPTVLPFKQRG
jgi:phage terminase small subunit